MPVGLEVCQQIVQLLVEEQVYNRLHWSESKNEIEDYLATHITFWPDNLKLTDSKTVKICQEFMQRYIDPIDADLHVLMDEHIGCVSDYNAMWMVWHVLRIGSDVVLEKSEDWRILEFERRRALGEW